MTDADDFKPPTTPDEPVADWQVALELPRATQSGKRPALANWPAPVSVGGDEGIRTPVQKI